MLLGTDPSGKPGLCFDPVQGIASLPGEQDALSRVACILYGKVEDCAALNLQRGKSISGDMVECSRGVPSVRARGEKNFLRWASCLDTRKQVGRTAHVPSD